MCGTTSVVNKKINLCLHSFYFPRTKHIVSLLQASGQKNLRFYELDFPEVSALPRLQWGTASFDESCAK